MAWHFFKDLCVVFFKLVKGVLGFLKKRSVEIQYLSKASL